MSRANCTEKEPRVWEFAKYIDTLSDLTRFGGRGVNVYIGACAKSCAVFYTKKYAQTHNISFSSAHNKIYDKYYSWFNNKISKIGCIWVEREKEYACDYRVGNIIDAEDVISKMSILEEEMMNKAMDYLFKDMTGFCYNRVNSDSDKEEDKKDLAQIFALEIYKSLDYIMDSVKGKSYSERMKLIIRILNNTWIDEYERKNSHFVKNEAGKHEKNGRKGNYVKDILLSSLIKDDETEIQVYDSLTYNPNSVNIPENNAICSEQFVSWIYKVLTLKKYDVGRLLMIIYSYMSENVKWAFDHLNNKKVIDVLDVMKEDIEIFMNIYISDTEMNTIRTIVLSRLENEEEKIVTTLSAERSANTRIGKKLR